MQNTYAVQARICKAFCEENRLRILALLRKNGELCACSLLDDLEIGQSALSYHMKILCESGVVSSRQEGKWTHYQINPNGAQQSLSLLQQLLSPTPPPPTDLDAAGLPSSCSTAQRADLPESPV